MMRELKRDHNLPTKKITTYLVIIGLALLSAVNYQLFVFPNKFAPAGLNGLCTMIQYVLHINVGYMNLLINIPLAFVVYRHVSKVIAIRSMVYVICFSLSLILLEHVDISAFAYSTQNGTSTILGPLVAGIINGACYSMLIKVCASTGGTDFVATLVRKKHAEMNFMWIVFALNSFVAFISYFVYGYEIEPVLLCILYSFMSSTVSDKVLKSGRSAIRFEIITDYAESLSEEIITKLHHSATLVPGKGMYSGHETNILVCIINKTQIPVLAGIIAHYPKTFAVMSSVTEVMGNFKHMNTNGTESNIYLDTGDGSAV